MARKFPKHTGFWWITLDDGIEYVIEPTLVRVLVHNDEYPGSKEIDVEWLDNSLMNFHMNDISQEIVSLMQTVAGGVISSSRRGDLRITWLGEAVPPKNAPIKGTDLPETLRVF